MQGAQGVVRPYKKIFVGPSGLLTILFRGHYDGWDKVGQNGMNGRFRGSYEATCDDRGRVKIPARYLSVLEEADVREFFVSSLRGEVVLIYPLPVWKVMEAQLEEAGLLDPDVDGYVSRLSYWGTESELDGKGRLLLSLRLRQAATLEGKLRLFGKGSYLELWQEARFEQQALGEAFTREQMHRVSRIIYGQGTESRSGSGSSGR